MFRPRRSVLNFAILFLLVVLSAQAQPPAESCIGADLDGDDMLPFVEKDVAVTTDAFTMTGPGCEELGLDMAVCFTPTISCNISIRCSTFYTDAINVFEGPCVDSPTSCFASATAPTAEIPDLGLTAGQSVCVVCETTAPVLDSLSIFIQELSGSCGALPVELQRFTIE